MANPNTRKVVAYRNKQGRVFKHTAALEKHKVKLQLEEMFSIPDENKKPSEREQLIEKAKEVVAPAKVEKDIDQEQAIAEAFGVKPPVKRNTRKKTQ